MLLRWAVVPVLFTGLTGALSRGDDAAAGEAVVTNVDGKETPLTELKFTTGTKRLAWLADPKGETEDARKGTLVLELREPLSTTYVQGVVTLIPVKSLEKISYDYEKKVVSLTLKGLNVPVAGELGYRSPVNHLGFTGTSDGKSASFMGGTAGKTAVKTAVFGGAEPLPRHKTGKLWNIQIDQPKADNPTLAARNLKAVYAFPGSAEELADGIQVWKSTPIPFDDNLKHYQQIAKDVTAKIVTAEVAVAAGPERVVAIPLTFERDKKVGTLVGILGEVDAGWKLFHLYSIKAITPSKRKIE